MRLKSLAPFFVGSWNWHMPLDLSRWLSRVFLAPDAGADAGGTAVADDTGEAGGAGPVADEGSPFDDDGGDTTAAPAATGQPSAQQQAAATGDEGTDEGETFEPAEIIASMDADLVAKARGYDLSDAEIAEYGDLLPSVLQRIEGFIVQQVTKQNQAPAAQPAAQAQAPAQQPVQPAQPQGGATAPTPGAFTFDPNAVIAAAAKRFKDADVSESDGRLFGEVMAEALGPIVGEVKRLEEFRQQLVAAEEARQVDHDLAEFNAAVEEMDTELFGKGEVKDGSPQFKAREEVWAHAYALAKGLHQMGKPVPSMKALVQSAYAAKHADRIAKKAQADMAGKARAQKHGIRPPRRQTHQPHAPTPEQRAVAAVAKKQGLPVGDSQLGPSGLPD